MSENESEKKKKNEKAKKMEHKIKKQNSKNILKKNKIKKWKKHNRGGSFLHYMPRRDLHDDSANRVPPLGVHRTLSLQVECILPHESER